MLAQAIEAERDEFLTHYRDQRSAAGLQAVVKSGYHPSRQVQTGLGPVAVRMPKVRSNTTEPVLFRSSLVPPYLRRSMQLEEFVPYLYLKGISSGDMADVLRMLVGDAQARGFSTGVVSRLKQVWEDEYKHWVQGRRSEPRPMGEYLDRWHLQWFAQ